MKECQFNTDDGYFYEAILLMFVNSSDSEDYQKTVTHRGKKKSLSLKQKNGWIFLSLASRTTDI